MMSCLTHFSDPTRPAVLCHEPAAPTARRLLRCMSPQVAHDVAATGGDGQSAQVADVLAGSSRLITLRGYCPVCGELRSGPKSKNPWPIRRCVDVRFTLHRVGDRVGASGSLDFRDGSRAVLPDTLAAICWTPIADGTAAAPKSSGLCQYTTWIGSKRGSFANQWNLSVATSAKRCAMMCGAR